MAMKPRVLYLMQYLEQNSDEQHPVTTAEIRKHLAAKGCPVSIITLRKDIKSLQEAGYKLVTVSELAEAYGYDLEPGGQYYAFYPGGCEENRTKQQGLDEIYDA